MSIYRIAVMVDGDNVSPVHAARILAAATKLGRVDVARVYASGAQPTDWFGVAGYRAMKSGHLCWQHLTVTFPILRTGYGKKVYMCWEWAKRKHQTGFGWRVQSLQFSSAISPLHQKWENQT